MANDPCFSGSNGIFPWRYYINAIYSAIGDFK